MFKVLIISALVAVACGAPRAPIPRLDGRIVGGKDINVEDVPYQVSLQYYGSHICGASIISEKWAVTAAHCTDGSSASSLSIRYGTSKRGSGGTVVNVVKINQNPDYDSWNIDGDISLLELASPIKLGAAAAPVGLPEEKQQVKEGSTAICSGWGTTSEGGSLPSQLKAVEVAIVGNKACQQAYSGYEITDNMICAGVPQGGKDACQGDSGGPLVVDGQLVGIVSWGLGCARPEYPGVYGSVPNLRSYIKKIANL